MAGGYRRGVVDRWGLLTETPDRRQALKKLGAGGLTVAAAGLAGAIGGSRVAAQPGDSSSDTYDEHSTNETVDRSYSDGDPSAGRLSAELPVGADAGPYGGPYAPPDDLAADALDHLTYAPPPTKGTVELEMSVVEVDHAVSRAHNIGAWTYNGTAPGPTIRATEGELIRIHFSNLTGHDHNLHFHGRHSPLQDGWEPIPPGGETVYEIVAGPAGVHPYHCHTMPIDRHISKGLYGTFIVDPVDDKRPTVDHEIVLALSGWDVNDDGRNELYSWNGVAGFYHKYPIKIPVGERVRAYVLNMTEFDPIASFHLHAEMFDVYPTGMGDTPVMTADIISLGQMERAALEFTLPELGRYMFHPHQHSMAHRGAMGWFAAV